MGLEATEVRVAGAGHVYVAPAGTALPEDLGALPVDFVDLGYVTTDGCTFTLNRETTNVDAWQGSKLRVLVTDDPVSVKFALMQSNADTFEVAFGGGEVTEPSPGVYKYSPPAKGENAERVLVIDGIDGDVTYRFVFARVQIEDSVEFALSRTAATTYPIPFGVLDNGDEDKWFLLSDDEALAVGS